MVDVAKSVKYVREQGTAGRNKRRVLNRSQRLHRLACLGHSIPDSPAVAAIDAEQIGVFPLMVEHQQFASDNR
jgi:hypothetical protein